MSTIEPEEMPAPESQSSQSPASNVKAAKTYKSGTHSFLPWTPEQIKKFYLQLSTTRNHPDFKASDKAAFYELVRTVFNEILTSRFFNYVQ